MNIVKTRPHLVQSLVALSLLLAVSGCAAPGPDAVHDAKRQNDEVPLRASKAAAIFLVEMVDARLMDFQEGKLAVERGTREDLREYGRRMMRDQAQLLTDLRRLAADMGVVVPSEIGAAKRDGLNDLLKLSGGKFDKAFIQSIRIDHERDVGKFKNAADLEDVAVATFARSRLPLIQSHLDGIEAIDKTY